VIFFFHFLTYILFFGWNIYSRSFLCFAFVLENHHSLDSRVYLRSTFFWLSTCLPFHAIDYAASLKIVPFTKTTSSDIFHIAAYCIEYIDSFVYSAYQEDCTGERSGPRGTALDQKSLAQSSSSSSSSSSTAIFPLAFVAAALEDLPAGAKVN